MSIKKIIKFPSPSLRVPCRPVVFPLQHQITDHIGDLADTLKSSATGVALASNQIIAEGHRVFVTKVDPTRHSLPAVVVNPFLLEQSPESLLLDEGCLSIPELWTKIAVPEWIDVSFQDEQGEEKKMRLEGFSAQIFCHEHRHLGGGLIYDELDKRSQLLIYNKAIRNRKQGR